MLDFADAKSKIDLSEVISFDIFDTLLKRHLSSPTDVFQLMNAEVSNLTGGLIRDFRALRVWSEKACLLRAQEQSEREEITFDEIYSVLAENSGLDGETCSKIKALEVNTELSCISKRKSGFSLYQYALNTRKIIVLASDMYLPREVIIRFLESIGLTSFHKLYLSSEINATKRSGSLFDIIVSDLKVNPKKILHIGDNELGDYKMPLQKGINSILLRQSIHNYRNANEFSIRLTSKFQRHQSTAKSAIDAIVADRFYDFGRSPKGPFFNNDPFQFGYVALAPLLLGFCCWLYREAKREKVQKLFFLSRDGQVMKSAFDVLFPQSESGIETDYVYCSRRAVRIAQLRTEHDLNGPLSQPIYARPLGEWLENNYGVDSEKIDLNIYLNNGFSGPSHPIGGKVNRALLEQLVYEIKDLIFASSKEERQTYIKYITSKGMNVGNNAVVDIGYAGTMQRSLSEFLDNKLMGFYLATFNSCLKELPDANLAKGYLSEFGSDSNQALGICTHRFVYESLICSSEDTFIKMVDDEEKIVPIFKGASFSSKRKEFVNYAHAGVVTFCKDYKELSPIVPRNTFISSELSTEILDTYLKNPHKNDVPLLFNIEFEDLYGVKTPRFIVTDPILSKTVKDDQVLWKEGLSTLRVNAASTVATTAAKQTKAEPTAAKKIQKTSPNVSPDIKSKNIDELVWFAKSYVKDGDFLSAAISFEEAYRIKCDRPNLLRQSAEAYYLNGNRLKSLRLLFEAKKQLPRNGRLKLRILVMSLPFLRFFIGEHKFET